jgi:hypothetical protein
VLRWAQLMVAALFVCVEILPVLMKFLLNIGKPTAYDRVLDQRDNEDADLHDIAYAGRRKVAQARADAKVDADADRIARQHQASLKVNKVVVRQQTKIVTKALAIWSAHAQRRAQQQLDEYEQKLQGTGGSASGSANAASVSGVPVAGSVGLVTPVPSHRGGGVNGTTTNGFVRAAQLPDLDDL